MAVQKKSRIPLERGWLDVVVFRSLDGMRVEANEIAPGGEVIGTIRVSKLALQAAHGFAQRAGRRQRTPADVSTPTPGAQVPPPDVRPDLG